MRQSPTIMARAAAQDRGPVDDPGAGPPGSRLAGLARRARQEGVRHLAVRALAWPFRRFVRVERVVFFVRDLRLPEPSTPTARVPVEFRLGTAEDVDRFAADLAAMGLAPAEARRRLAAGDVAYFGVLDGALVHQAWETSATPYVDEIGMRLVLGPGETTSYEALTAPAWRGLGIQPASISFRNRSRLERGIRRHLFWVLGSNVANLRVHDKLGSVRIATVWTLWVSGMARPRVLAVVPRGALRLAPP